MADRGISQHKRFAMGEEYARGGLVVPRKRVSPTGQRIPPSANVRIPGAKGMRSPLTKMKMSMPSMAGGGEACDMHEGSESAAHERSEERRKK